ncbi:MAG TPA: hypothetical protein VFK86_14045 [Bauldia sp.]|nr:hypothetical protein [Bauldia sp.]
MTDVRTFGAAAKRALSSYVAYNLVNYALGFAFQILLVKTLPATEYATYMVLFGFLFALDSFLSLGVDRTLKRFIPIFVHAQDRAGMRALGRRLALVRAGTLIAFVVGLVFGHELLGGLLPTGASPGLLIAFGVWFVAYRLFQDMDSLAQGLVQHGMSVALTTGELLLRIGTVTAVLFLSSDMTAEVVVTISAVTLTLLDVVLAARLKQWMSSSAETGAGVDPPRSDREALAQIPGFMAAAYGSTLGWMIANPSVIRIVASTGLQVTVLAAFSFLQALAGALQRLFPGLLLLPVLEPILAGMSLRGRNDQTAAALSFIFKLDLAIVLGATIAVAIAGRDIVTLLSQAAYADYYGILFVLFASIFLNTIYRVFEISAALIFKQRIFLFLWPISLISVALVYLTVDAWGLTAALLWPLAENLVRITLLFFVFRHDGIWRSFDLASAARLAGSAAVIGGAMLAVGVAFGISAGLPRIVFAVVAALLFVASWLVIRPFRPAEIDLASRMLPELGARLRPLAMRLARGQDDEQR